MRLGNKISVYSIVSCIIFTCAASLTQGQTTYVSQDFSSSTTVGDYANSTSPNSGQFNFISNGGGSVAISDGELEFVKSVSGGGVLARSTDFSPVPSVLLVQFDLTVPTSAAVQTTAARFSIGQNFTSSTAAPANGDIHSVLGVNFVGTSGGFSLRNIGSGTNSATFTGQRTIRWYINNSGSTYTYTAPDGTTETLANDAADIYVGTTRVFNEVAATTATVALTDFKFTFNGGSGAVNGSIKIDNISITAPADTPLPVEFSHFDITLLKDLSVQLRWETASELNNAGFEVYRSDDNTENSFKKIASYLTDENLRGLGTSPYGKNYTYIDKAENLTPGHQYFYKLVNVDFDGTRTEQEGKNIAVVSDESAIISDSFASSPNPARDEVNIGFTLAESNEVTIVVYNSLGQIAAVLAQDEMRSAGAHTIQYPTATLPVGIYTIYVMTADRTFTRSLSIVH
ncbi:MAG: T9SS type A sorting domain-containing protein [Bacteroidota bacterium]